MNGIRPCEYGLIVGVSIDCYGDPRRYIVWYVLGKTAFFFIFFGRYSSESRSAQRGSLASSAFSEYGNLRERDLSQESSALSQLERNSISMPEYVSSLWYVGACRQCMGAYSGCSKSARENFLSRWSLCVSLMVSEMNTCLKTFVIESLSYILYILSRASPMHLVFRDQKCNILTSITLLSLQSIWN